MPRSVNELESIVISSSRIGSCEITKVQMFCYSVGHVLNDLCSAMWFSYFIIFFHQVLEIDSVTAGNFLLIGQVADAIGTPFVGYESDRTPGCRFYGIRKSWHLFGVISVACSFVFVFNNCIDCTPGTDSLTKYIYYVPFICLFQFGWASSQISHLAIIPELTQCKKIRGDLNGYRFAFTVSSNIYVFVVFTILLSIMDDTSSSDNVGPGDLDTFKYLGLIVVCTGVFFMAIFHVGLREPDRLDLESKEVSVQCSSFTWDCWFKEPQFYVIGFVYMQTRLIYNFTQVYYPLYISETLNLDKQSIAVLPLVVFISGFVGSLMMPVLNKFLSRKIIYAIALLLGFGYCALAWFLQSGNNDAIHKGYQFGLSIIMGLSNGTLLVTALSLTSDMIGPRTHCGAIAYGCFSFLDKMSNGIAVQIAQIVMPSGDTSEFYRYCISVIPAAFFCVAIVFWFCLLFFKVGELSRDKEAEPSNNNININDPNTDIVHTSPDHYEDIICLTNGVRNGGNLLVHSIQDASGSARSSRRNSSHSHDHDHDDVFSDCSRRVTLDDVRSYLYAPGVLVRPSRRYSSKSKPSTPKESRSDTINSH